MSRQDIESKVQEIRELKRMQDELSAELEALTYEIKAHMDADGVDTISGTDWKVTYKAVTSSRIDTSALRKAAPELCEKFTKSVETKRFCVA